MADIRISRLNLGILETRVIDDSNLASFVSLGWVYPAVEQLSLFDSQATMCRTTSDLRAIPAGARRLAACLDASTKGIYFFDPFSSSSESLPTVVTPTSGSGRWILIGQLDSGGGGGGSPIPGDLPVFIQDTDPAISGKYLWVQTNVGGNPSNISLWIDDGV